MRSSPLSYAGRVDSGTQTVGPGIPLSLYFVFSDSDAWPERWKWKYILSGIFPFRFLTVFAFFSLAAAVRTAVHENFGADHLNKKCYFLEGFGHPEF